MTHALEQAAADLIMDFLKARQYAGRKEAAAAAMRATAAQECYLACRPLHATAMQQYLYVSAAVSGMHACCMADACRRACNSSAASCATIGVHAFQACKSERLAVGCRCHYTLAGLQCPPIVVLLFQKIATVSIATHSCNNYNKAIGISIVCF
eukprot:1161603-Pelagomonas_calceolata.AAC.16